MIDQEKAAPVRNHMMPDEWYQGLDKGIRFAVRVLHAAGIADTCQSCEGGPGHAYEVPSVDIVAGGEDAQGFAALAALQQYGLGVRNVALVWSIQHGLPYEKLWRITFWKACPERADDVPSFIPCYQAQAQGEVVRG